MDFARALWIRLETLHAVTYFGEETQAATRRAGLRGFWMGYFGLRAAPLGPVGPALVTATFNNFAPSFVARWVPEVWDHATPDHLLALRSEAAAATLRRVVPEIEVLAQHALPLLQAASDRASTSGRPLFAANRAVARPADPVAALWQCCTDLREHRGDGHVAALVAAGLDGLEAHVLIALDHGADPEDLQRTRGWTVADWLAAEHRLQTRGLVERDGSLSLDGRAVRNQVEATTDTLARAPWAAGTDEDRHDLLALLTPAATAVSQAGILRYPNPMGLPPV